MTSGSGWIMPELYIEWLKFVIASIAPARPVLLIEDWLVSHVTLSWLERVMCNY